jgi:hypothetical protein
MNYTEKIISEFEGHCVNEIIDCFKNGVDPNSLYKNEPLINELIAEYSRGTDFKLCFQAFVDYGLVFEDKILLAVFLDDAVSLDKQLNQNPTAINKKYSYKSAFTPLFEVSLLHICSEFNHIACAKILVKYGIDVNIKAGVDKNGFGGQTPIFHTVNQIQNKSAEMFYYLLEESADLDITVAGLIWGNGYDWETLIPSVNPISYAMMGLLRQMHRDETIISGIVTTLLKHKYGIEYLPMNVPCKYLK